MANFKPIVSGTDPLASDVQQIIDSLTGAADIGGLALFVAISQPGALTAAASATAGNPNGTYTYKVTFCTGYKDSDGTVRINAETQGGTTSAGVTVASKQINLTNLPLGPAGAVARRIYRTAAGGADGTQQLVTTINDNVTTTWTDNVADASLGAAVPTSNSTGSSLSLSTTQFTLSGVTPDQTQAPSSPGTGTLTQVLSWLTNRIKAITGATNWWDAPATTLATTNTHIGSTSNPHGVTAAQLGASAILAQIQTVDGAGSGLDADLLDGKHLSDLRVKDAEGAILGTVASPGSTISNNSSTAYVLVLQVNVISDLRRSVVPTQVRWAASTWNSGTTGMAKLTIQPAGGAETLISERAINDTTAALAFTDAVAGIVGPVQKGSVVCSIYARTDAAAPNTILHRGLEVTGDSYQGVS